MHVIFLFKERQEFLLEILLSEAKKNKLILTAKDTGRNEENEKNKFWIGTG
jgi:hypothetical protein